MSTFKLIILSFMCVLVAPAQAQILGEIGSAMPDITVRGQGWTQLRDLTEMTEFVLAFLETTVMITLLAFHPVAIANRQVKTDFDAPRSLYIYALIGMVVGFLIMHHGYLIGFVLFGIGGLLRFRTDDVAADTMRLILATLIGLSVGLNLPVIALATTLGIWVVLYVFGVRTNYAIEVRFSEKARTSDAMLGLRDNLNSDGYNVISMSKTKFKPMVHYVVAARSGKSRSGLERAVSKLVEKVDSDIDDWHIF